MEVLNFFSNLLTSQNFGSLTQGIQVFCFKFSVYQNPKVWEPLLQIKCSKFSTYNYVYWYMALLFLMLDSPLIRFMPKQLRCLTIKQGSLSSRRLKLTSYSSPAEMEISHLVLRAHSLFHILWLGGKHLKSLYLYKSYFLDVLLVLLLVILISRFFFFSFFERESVTLARITKRDSVSKKK